MCKGRVLEMLVVGASQLFLAHIVQTFPKMLQPSFATPANHRVAIGRGSKTAGEMIVGVACAFAVGCDFYLQARLAGRSSP
jgi:hypothetical protein